MNKFIHASTAIAAIMLANAPAMGADGFQNRPLFDVQMNRVEHIAQARRADSIAARARVISVR